LIARLLADPAWSRTAVIVNEFGDIPLDHHLIASADETLMALTTGCLCCAVQTDLARTLLGLHRRRAAGEIAYDRVVIETSGLADPAPILHALMTDKALTETHSIAAILTLVDAELGQRTIAQHPEAWRQIGLADRLLLTKTDRVPPSKSLITAIRALNPTAPIVTAAPNPASLFTAPPVLPPTPSPRVAHTGDVAAISVTRASPIPAVALPLWLEALTREIGTNLLRLKGLVDITEFPGQPAVLHAVQHIVAPIDLLDAWPGARETRIVLIGRNLDPAFPAILLERIISEVHSRKAARPGR
jgi:G3E family GTPase